MGELLKRSQALLDAFDAPIDAELSTGGWTTRFQSAVSNLRDAVRDAKRAEARKDGQAR